MKLLISFYLTCSMVLLAQDAAFPYAPGIKDSITNNVLWDEARVKAHAKDTINDPGGNDIPTRDNAAMVGMLGYKSTKKNETKLFSTELLDLTNITDFVKISILVDDEAYLTVTAEDFSHAYVVNGTALWNPRSFKTFDVVLEPGKIYALNLTYKNNAHLTGTLPYAGKFDHDGINIYLSKADPAEWLVQKRHHKALARIGYKGDANVGFTPVDGYIEYDVCWLERHINGGNEYKNLEWILTERPFNQNLGAGVLLVDRLNRAIIVDGKPLVTGNNATWSIREVGSTIRITDKMEIGAVKFDFTDYLVLENGGDPPPKVKINSKGKWASPFIDNTAETMQLIDSGHGLFFSIRDSTGKTIMEDPNNTETNQYHRAATPFSIKKP